MNALNAFLDTLRRRTDVIPPFVGGFLIPLLTELASALLQATWAKGVTGLIRWSGLVIAAVLILMAMVRALRPQLDLVPEAQKPARHPGLIVLVGTGRKETADPMTEPAVPAIEYHLGTSDHPGPLRACWLIATVGEKGSLPRARAIKAAFADRIPDIYVRTLADPFSVQEAHDCVEKIYAEEIAQVGLTESQVIADFTGGVKPMSAGMILACRERRPMQYMYGHRPGIASVPRLVEFVPRRRPQVS